VGRTKPVFPFLMVSTEVITSLPAIAAGEVPVDRHIAVATPGTAVSDDRDDKPKSATVRQKANAQLSPQSGL
jgi:hypothetical protein